MAIDRADHHTLPPGLPAEAALTHIGIYLAWIVLHGLASEELDAMADDLRERKETGRDLLLSHAEGKLWDEDLSEEGQAFTAAYYVDDGGYFDDYRAAFAELPSIYHVEDTWASYERIAPRISAAHARWQREQDD